MKIVLGIEYDGSSYHGWQKQKNCCTIQDTLEKALSKLANESIVVFSSGRTDSGVHAIYQVVHFCTFVIRSKNSWIHGTNFYLPSNISVIWCVTVNQKFHARFSVISKQYRYVIYNYPVRSAIFFSYVLHYRNILNIKNMSDAGKFLLGKHDFTAFRSSGCQARSPWKKIYFLKIFKYENFIIIDIKANSFLYKMVRNIVSCLISIGSGKKDIFWIKKLLFFKKKKVIKTASQKGLYLYKVEYPKFFKIPINYSKNFFLFNF